MGDDFMSSRIAQSCREYVCADAYDYNFVIPKSLVIKLNAVTEDARRKRQDPQSFNLEEEAEQPERFTKEIVAFSGTPALHKVSANDFVA
ncbi:hypothetical protein V7S43_011345 [Phytophthora oleae]|uniref:Uncharacterized protein n=1 Tax=Phytophthora oleae TaxID=2107226 RepID=A0ABD3FAL1_9STRA